MVGACEGVMLRGIRRLFAVLAVGWVMLTSWVFLSDPGSLSNGAVFQIIIIGGFAIYGAGWLAGC